MTSQPHLWRVWRCCPCTVLQAWIYFSDLLLDVYFIQIYGFHFWKGHRAFIFEFVDMMREHVRRCGHLLANANQCLINVIDDSTQTSKFAIKVAIKVLEFIWFIYFNNILIMFIVWDLVSKPRPSMLCNYWDVISWSLVFVFFLWCGFVCDQMLTFLWHIWVHRNAACRSATSMLYELHIWRRLRAQFVQAPGLVFQLTGVAGVP